jgi:hypothetical protein
MAVGARRYNEMEARLGEAPSWAHFLDPETGDLLPREDLQTESPEDRETRVIDVLKLVGGNKELKSEVATFGFTRSRWLEWWKRAWGSPR